MSRLLALVRKEIIQILRDPISLMIMFIMPGFMLTLFGVAISLDVDRIKLAVWDLDKTPESREFVRRLTGSGYFDVVAHAGSDAEIQRLVDGGKASVALKIPPGFERNLRAIRPSPVRIVVDGSDNNTASITISYVNLIVQQYSTERFLDGLKGRGLATERADLPLELESRVWYNPELESERFLVPGLIGLVMMVSTTVLTALSIVREKERGTIEMLMVSPITRVELVVGKIFPYFVIAFINIIILVFLARVLFGVPFRGDIFLFFALSAVFLLTALGFGTFISTLASSQQVAWTICMLTTVLPSFLLSGFIFPVENMPWGIRIFTYLVPVRYFIVILRGILLKGVGAESLAAPIMSLIAFAVAMVAISSRRIARRLT
ncbi:MAG: ABC transporter permease [Candidatus Abyssubacteria bacterium]|nr:ABC transporter permease [Candidatus Abyssubacteria bacterium]